LHPNAVFPSGTLFATKNSMNLSKKTVIISLAAILLLCAARFVSSADKKTVCVADNNSLLNLLDDETAKPTISIGSNSNPGVTGLFYKMIFMVLMVVVLGIAVIYFSKKLLPKMNLPGKKIHLAETIHIGPRKSIHLIKIGSRTLLIGSTNESITNLADVSDEILETEE
jgi:flagellar biogenesis protein FliO